MQSEEQEAILTLFVPEIYFQSVAGLKIRERIQRFPEEKWGNRPFGDVESFDWWDELRMNAEELFNRAANLSKIFFSNKNKNRSEYLRQIYSISEVSVIFDREIRNISQHLDERLDQMYLGNISRSKPIKKEGFSLHSNISIDLGLPHDGTFVFEKYGASVDRGRVKEMYNEFKRLVDISIELDPRLQVSRWYSS